jgi:hypothetical protein
VEVVPVQLLLLDRLDQRPHSMQRLAQAAVAAVDLALLILGHLVDLAAVLDHWSALEEAEQLDKEILEAIMP